MDRVTRFSTKDIVEQYSICFETDPMRRAMENYVSQVIKRFRHIFSNSTRAQLYKAFLMPYFQYCSKVWFFCGAKNSQKLELLNKHAVYIILMTKSVHMSRFWISLLLSASGAYEIIFFRLHSWLFRRTGT